MWKNTIKSCSEILFRISVELSSFVRKVTWLLKKIHIFPWELTSCMIFEVLILMGIAKRLYLHLNFGKTELQTTKSKGTMLKTTMAYKTNWGIVLTGLYKIHASFGYNHETENHYHSKSTGIMRKIKFSSTMYRW